MPRTKKDEKKIKRCKDCEHALINQSAVRCEYCDLLNTKWDAFIKNGADAETTKAINKFLRTKVFRAATKHRGDFRIDTSSFDELYKVIWEKIG